MAYQRQNAVNYAHQWAFSRNPKYLDFANLGGDCTNFISQCLLAGGAPMDYRHTYGWYYNSADDRAPAWTSAHYLHQYLLRKDRKKGVYADEIPLSELEIGDITQITFDGIRYTHSQIVVAVGYPVTLEHILIATHDEDSDYRPLQSYTLAKKFRFLRIGINY